MVAVTAKDPSRHQMSLASKRQRPANPASHLPHATAADEQPVAPEKAPNPKVMPLTTTRSGRMVKPVQKAHQPDDVGTCFDKENTSG